jgi:hypothetical protein
MSNYDDEFEKIEIDPKVILRLSYDQAAALHRVALAGRMFFGDGGINTPLIRQFEKALAKLNLALDEIGGLGYGDLWLLGEEPTPRGMTH